MPRPQRPASYTCAADDDSCVGRLALVGLLDIDLDEVDCYCEVHRCCVAACESACVQAILDRAQPPTPMAEDGQEQQPGAGSSTEGADGGVLGQEGAVAEGVSGPTDSVSRKYSYPPLLVDKQWSAESQPLVQSMIEDDIERRERTSPEPDFTRDQVKWYKGGVGRAEFLSSYSGLPATVQEEARYLPAMTGFGLQFCNMLKSQQQQRDLLAEVGRLFSSDPKVQAAYIAPRKEAMQLAHDKSVFLLVDSTGQVLTALRSPVGSYTFGQGCQHHGLCSHATSSCVAVDAVAHAHLVDRVPLVSHPAQRLHFDAIDDYSAISCLFNGVMAVAHRPAHTAAEKALMRALDLLSSMLSEEADKHWCERQKKVLRARYLRNKRTLFPKGQLTQLYQGMMNPGFPVTPPLPNPGEDYPQLLANQEAARICNILAAGEPEGSAEVAAAQPPPPQVASGSQGPNAAGARVSVFHPDRLESVSPGVGPVAVAVGAPPVAAVQPPKPWETVQGLAQLLCHLIGDPRRKWPSVVFGLPDLRGGPVAFYEVEDPPKVTLLQPHMAPWAHPRFLGVLQGSQLVKADGQVTVDFAWYCTTGEGVNVRF